MADTTMSSASTLVDNSKEKDNWSQNGSPGFNNALRKFKNRLTQKQIESFKITKIEDVLDSMRIIQAQQDSQKGLMAMARLRGFIEAMKELGQIVEVFLNTSEAVAFVWGPIKFLLQVASTWTHSLDTLLDAYEQIGETVPLLRQYEALFKGNPHLLKVAEMIYEDILTFHQSALKFFNDKTWKQLFKSAWKTFDSKFKHILAGLHRHQQLLTSQVDIIHLQQYDDDRNRAQIKLENIQVKLLHSELASIRQWLGGEQAISYHEQACNARTYCPGSGAWILKHDKISAWMLKERPERPIAWMHGIPGAGKTVLASVIIQNCLDFQSHATAYFYAKHTDQEANSAVSVLRSLLSQSVACDPDLVPFFFERYMKSHEPTLVNLENAKQLLTLVCQRPGRKYFIVDGIDECNSEEQKMLLIAINKLIEKTESQDPGKIRVLIVSQDEPDIRKYMGTASHIPLRTQDSESDIASFVVKKCSDIKAKFDLTEDQEKYIGDLTCHKAGGMFLYAALVTENLHSQATREALILELREDRFPEGLKEAYHRILHRIKTNSSSSEWQLAQKLLGWMICAKRPFKWREMQGAISIRRDRDEVDFDTLKLRRHIKDICGSLLLILPGDRVVLVHSTADQYIMDSNYVRRELVECQMISMCLRYLTMSCFTELDERTLQHFAISGYYSFQDYAFAKWHHHICTIIESLTAQMVQDSSDRDLSDALFELCEISDDFKIEFVGADSEEGSQQSKLVPSLALPNEMLQLLKVYDIQEYDALQSLWVHAMKHQAQDLETRNNLSTKQLADALKRSRKVIESLTAEHKDQSPDRARLDEFYGTNRYRCPKLTCRHFHEGFPTDRERQLHINKHERPFQCTFADCSAAEFGYSTKKDLEKHVRAVHPEFEDQATVFPEPPPKKTDYKHTCVTCGKVFSRKQILRSHYLAHSGEKPFPCSYCGKAFTRDNDKKRHERTIHEHRMN